MKEYKVVFNLEGQPFDEMVSQCMNDGWQLHGNPWSHQEPEGGLVHLYQAITREVTVQYVMVEEDDENAEAAAAAAKDEKKED